MLKLYHVTYYRLDNPNETLSRFVLAYSPCHAVNLLYREHDSNGELNVYRHGICEEVPCIHPLQFKKSSYGQAN